MSLQQRLDLKLGQSLVMTPQLRLAIKMLQLSSQELSEMIAEQLEENPVLTSQEEEIENRDNTSEDPAEVDLEKDDTLDEYSDYEEYSGGISEENNYEEYVAGEKSLSQHIMEQFAIDEPCPKKRMIADYIINNLTPAGYLEEPISEIASMLGATEGEVERVLYKIQRYDPAGIGARNLAECIRIQLSQMDELTQDVDMLLDNLEQLSQNGLVKTAKSLGLQVEVAQEILEIIRTVNPRPATAFGHVAIDTRVPDVIVKKGSNGWVVELNSDTLPKILLDRRYVEQVGKTSDKDTKKYLNEKINSANWFLRAIEQRAETMLKVSSKIIEMQSDFLEHGLSHLKPLVLRDIATAIDMHESTVSRVTTNKYMATPRGVFELKYFFTSSIASTDSNSPISSELVRQKIKSLIDGESPKGQLSDEGLVKSLKSYGIDVARRTVTKYREAMNIPSSYERKNNARI